MMNNQYAEICKEVLIVLDKLPPIQRDMISKSMIENLERESQNCDGIVKWDILGQPIVSKEAKAMLIAIYQKYFLTDENRELLEKKLQENDRLQEEKKKKRLANDIFYQNALGIEKYSNVQNQVNTATDYEETENEKEEKALVDLSSHWLVRIKQMLLQLKNKILEKWHKNN